LPDLLIILFIFALVLVLLRLMLNLGLVMFIGALALGVLKGLGPVELVKVSAKSAADPKSVMLIAALALIMVLENVMKKTGTMKTLVDSLKGIVGDSRVVMALMPAIIGILPSPGGARFSAPLVEESACGCEIHKDRLSFINHWFRHVWEYVSPLFPGFIMASAIAEVKMGALFRYQVAFPLTVLAIGTVYGFKGIHAEAYAPSPHSKKKLFGMFFVSFSPILAVMLLVFFGVLNIAWAMVVAVGGMMVYFRYTPARIYQTLKESLFLKTLVLVAGIMVFKGMMEHTHVVETLPGFFAETGIPIVAVLFILPFMVGLMTGITLAFVSVTFPMLLPMIGGAGHPDMGMLAFAYASGFAGVMFSPVHLCLVLTKDYFHSELTPIYKQMIVPQTAVVLVAAIQMLVF